LSDSSNSNASGAVDYEKLGRDELLALLHDVTAQRDKVLAQYEAMTEQVDASGRDVASARLEAERNTERAAESERRAESEAARAADLARQLDEDRRKRDEIAGEFARFREAAAHTSVEDPWSVLSRALSQIVGDWVAWARAKIPPDSALLPWFDRAVDLSKKAGCLALGWGKALVDWATPRAVELWKWLKAEFARRANSQR